MGKSRKYSRSPSAEAPCVIGFDTEYQQEGDLNHVVSAQWCGIWQGRSWSGFLEIDGKRMKLTAFIEMALQDGQRQRAFTRFPAKVVLAAHFAIADLATMEDFHKFKMRFDGLRKTYCSIQDSLGMRVRDVTGQGHNITLELRDTRLLTPQSRGLAELGKLHNCPKIELPPGAIEKMQVFLQELPEEFREYAIRDAEIAALHTKFMSDMNQTLTGENTVPISLGSLAAVYCQKLFEQNNLDRLQVLGREVVENVVFDDRRQRYVKRKVEVSVPELSLHQQLLIECFHGGRNEAYAFGPSEIDEWLDVDLCSAYTTALASAGLPQWKECHASTNINDFKTGEMGFAWVEFEFPESVRFPCLPVRAPNNLIFPLTGESYATAAEIAAARRPGAAVRVKHGVIIPQDMAIRPFETVIAALQGKRKEADLRGDKLSAGIYKELGNSLYGKTCQGLREKRVFDNRTGQHRDMPPSCLTCVVFAAHVTGLIRAALGEVMNALPATVSVLSCTTDGFVCNATREELDAASAQPACDILRECRSRLHDTREILEVKHGAQQILVWRTRGQATGEKMEEREIVLAKAGLNMGSIKDTALNNTTVILTFKNRCANDIWFSQSLPSPLHLFKKGGDFIALEREHRLNMEYDFKRTPTDPVMRGLRGGMFVREHLAFTTRPWRDLKSYQRTRELFDNFSFQRHRILKTVDDYRDFEEYCNGAGLVDMGMRRTEGGLPKMALRVVLRAFKARLRGFTDTMTDADLMRALNEAGYAVRVDDLKNAGRHRKPPVMNLVPRTPETLQLAAAVRAAVPEFDDEKLFAAQELNAA